MAMTRKDYFMVAKAIHNAIKAEENKHIETIRGMRSAAESIAATFSLLNDKFQPALFLSVAGVMDDSIEDALGSVDESNSQ